MDDDDDEAAAVAVGLCVCFSSVVMEEGSYTSVHTHISCRVPAKDDDEDEGAAVAAVGPSLSLCV